MTVGQRRRTRYGAMVIVVCLSALLMATLWDADGDPTTDNLPQITLTVDPPEVEVRDDQTSDVEDESSTGLSPLWGRRPRLIERVRAAFSLLWRPLLPLRGP